MPEEGEQIAIFLPSQISEIALWLIFFFRIVNVSELAYFVCCVCVDCVNDHTKDSNVPEPITVAVATARGGRSRASKLQKQIFKI